MNDDLRTTFSYVDPRLVERFISFHEDNPHVYEEFERQARRLLSMGRTRYSAWTIITWIRFEQDLRTTGDPFQINNDYTALYARLLIHRCPEFNGFFELRRMKGSDRHLSDEERTREGLAVQ